MREIAFSPVKAPCLKLCGRVFPVLVSDVQAMELLAKARRRYAARPAAGAKGCIQAAKDARGVVERVLGPEAVEAAGGAGLCLGDSLALMEGVLAAVVEAYAEALVERHA